MSPQTQQQPPNGREIREEASYASDLAELKIAYEDIDIAFESVSWVLMRRPDIFPGVAGLHRLKIKNCGNLPDLCVWFTFDDHYVYLKNVDEILDDD